MVDELNEVFYCCNMTFSISFAPTFCIMDITGRNLAQVVFVLASYMSTCTGRVEIQQPYHPLYVKVGEDLNIRCESNERRELEWFRQTPPSWDDDLVVAQQASDIEITSCSQEPSGFVESKLTKKNVQLSDRGTYTCQTKSEDDYHSFSIWVIALKIIYQNATAQGGQTLKLHCNISGFDNNPPTMDFAWLKGGYETGNKYDERINTDMSALGELSLTITHPVSSDAGHYQCQFFLYTDLGSITVMQDIYVFGSESLPSSSCGCRLFVGLLLASVMATMSAMRLL